MTSKGEQITGNNTLQQIEDDNFQKQKEMLQCLTTIWNKVGVDEDQKLNRANQVWGHVLDLMREIIDEETGLYEDIKERIRNYEKKIAELTTELGLPASEEVTGTLIVREECLRQQLDELSKMKHKRLKEFQELHLQELKYCHILSVPPHKLSSNTGVPTENDIYELKQHVNMLKEEKDFRQKKFYMLKKELTTILEITELAPETPLEKEILTSKEDSLSLSNETFKMLEQIVAKKKSKKADLENEKAVLMDKLSVLWDILKVEKEERDFFLSRHTDCRVSNLNAIKDEIARCEEIKKQNISKYVEALKEELSSLLEKCFISKSLKKLSFMPDGEIDDTILESYDNEVAKWRKYYKDTEHIMQKIKRRHELWDLMNVFETKASDPNRFKNRGGNLLQEERERKKIQKDLPALENEIFLDIEKYEEETGKPFLYFGESFRVFVTNQWDNRLAQKENEKMMKQKLRTKQLEDGRITPSAKRPFTSATPKSAPSKLFKSSVGVSIYRTPNFSVSKQMPSTVARMKTRRVSKQQSNSNKKSERKVLGEKNENTATASGSDCLDSTTYTDFADKLNRSSRCAHRSSVLCSKKIAGTRISVNKSKRKSANKSGLKKNNAKITPARGKLGLPFLI